MAIITQPSYWSHQGTYQALYEKLAELIPAEGEVPDSKRKNRNLEKLRRASNCYYDLFNNGLCNRAAEFARVFGFSGKQIVRSRFYDISGLEVAMDEIILAAALEQGLAKVVPVEPIEHTTDRVE